MWPMKLIPPFYPESFIVMLVDKIIASKEFAMKILFRPKE
jgi:hypothetical protein